VYASGHPLFFSASNFHIGVFNECCGSGVGKKADRRIIFLKIKTVSDPQQIFSSFIARKRTNVSTLMET
jgi:hypothetical protein